MIQKILVHDISLKTPEIIDFFGELPFMSNGVNKC